MSKSEGVLFLDQSIDDLLADQRVIQAVDHPDELMDVIAGLRVLEDAGFEVRSETTVWLEDDGTVFSAYPTWTVTVPGWMEDSLRMIVWDSKYTPYPSFNRLLVRSTRPGVRWQLTTFDPTGQPWGHQDHDTLASALKEIGGDESVVQVSMADGSVHLRKGATRLANPAGSLATIRRRLLT